MVQLPKKQKNFKEMKYVRRENRGKGEEQGNKTKKNK